MPNYTKLFNSIVTSTIWTEDDKTRIVWITMLAIADQNGEVHASIPGLARLAGVSLESTEAAIEKFLSPDEYSRTPDNEGRRIEKIDGGWELLNHAKYRRMASIADQKDSNAKRQQRFRERNAPVTASNATVTEKPHIAEAEAEVDSKNKRMAKPSLSQVSEYGMTLTPPFRKAESFLAFYESNGWKVGKNTMKDWKAAVRTWNQKEKQSAAENTRPIYQQQNGTKRANLWD